MTRSIYATISFALLAGTAHAVPPTQNVNDRMEALCAVSDADMIGKRLARECRAQVRAQQQLSTQATATAQKAEGLPAAEPQLAQLPK